MTDRDVNQEMPPHTIEGAGGSVPWMKPYNSSEKPGRHSRLPQGITLAAAAIKRVWSDIIHSPRDEDI